MIHLYHCKGARSFRALWALEEVGIPYTLDILPFPPRAKSPGYTEINPLGTVPFMMIDGEAMSESAAIVEYLAGRYGRGSIEMSSDDPAYPTYLNFLHMSDATLTFPLTLYLRYSILEPDARKSAQVAEDYRRWFLGRLTAALGMFKGRYTCGERFTAADIAVGYALKLARTIGISEDLPVAANDYSELLTNRPAYMRALEAERR